MNKKIYKVLLLATAVAAIATIIAQMASCIAAFIYLYKKRIYGKGLLKMSAAGNVL